MKFLRLGRFFVVPIHSWQTALFSFAEDSASIVVLAGDVFEANRDQLADFFSVMGHAGYELVVG
jgi:hypothetical protein